MDRSSASATEEPRGFLSMHDRFCPASSSATVAVRHQRRGCFGRRAAMQAGEFVAAIGRREKPGGRT